MASSTLYDLIVFDCDGVLVDSEMIASRELAAYLADFGVYLTPEISRQRFTGCSLATVQQNIEAEDGITLPATFEADLQKRDRAAFDRGLKPIPGVRALLLSLAIPFGVASSGSPEKIHHSLTLTGLLEFFENRIFSAHMVTKGKPAPDLFLLTARELGADASRCLVIEDSPVGVEAALAADMDVIGFAGGSHCGPNYAEQLSAAGAKKVVHSMEEIGALFTI